MGIGVGVPDAPVDVALDVLSGADVQVTFEPPLTDGGAAVQSYNIEWDTDPGEQEIQTITTSADEVTPEVQTVTTTANDVDEVQTLTLAATFQDEVQIVRSTVASVPEKQRITYAVKRVDEVQTFGFYLLDCNTNQGTVAATKAALEAQLANVPALEKISVKFDIADCGSAEGVNFCQRGVDEDTLSTTPNDLVSAMACIREAEAELRRTVKTRRRRASCPCRMTARTRIWRSSLAASTGSCTRAAV